MNNKGFAITTILYGTLILFLMLMISMLGILSTYSGRLEMLIENVNGARFNINYENILFRSSSEKSGYSDFMKWDESNDDGIIIVTSRNDSVKDGYGFVPYRVKLIAGESYYFSCDSNGKWPNDVEAFLMLNGVHNEATTRRLSGNKSFEFVPSVTGTYWLRLDVNKLTGGNNTFSNIKILGKKKV